MTFLGLDVRTSSILAALVDDEGRVHGQATLAGSDAAAAARAVGSGNDRPAAVGMATDESPAPAGRAGAPPPAAVVSHGAGLALAEQWCGAARDARHVVALTADHTVSAGVVVEGRLFGGARGLAGAAGWLALNPVEREDYRRHGCLEAEVGGPGIVRRLVWRIKSGDRSQALDLAGGDLNAITAQQVFEAARLGDGVAISVVRDTAKYIGMAVANLVAILDPDIVVLGGAIAGAGDLLLEPTRAEMTRRVAPAAREVPVVPSALGEVAPAIGAARAAMLASR